MSQVKATTYHFDKPLVGGVFLERPNRFVAMVEFEGEVHRVQVPDPGRLKELFIPGVKVILEDHKGATHRKTRYSLIMVRSPEDTHWVSVNSHLPNRLMKNWLQEGVLEVFRDYRLEKPEFTYGSSRFDFLLSHKIQGTPLLVEVKSVTLVLDGETAMFPDAPTVRGARHIRELMVAQKEGYEVGVFFLIQRPDAKRVVPNRETDPDFYQTVEVAMKTGVSFWAMATEISPEGVRLLPKLLPVEL